MKRYSISTEIQRLKSLFEPYTSNETLNCFNQDLVTKLERIDDSFIKGRIDKSAKLLSTIKTIDYDGVIKSAYDDYNEAAIFYILKYVKGIDISNIKETSEATPDFKLHYNGKELFVEMKSLAFGNGNLNYIEASHQALDAKIDLETQRKKGRRICSSIRTICPFHCKDVHEELLNIYKKVDNSIKPAQFSSGDTIMLFDLSQISMEFEFEPNECVSTYLYRDYILQGRFWNITFGKKDYLAYVEPEFEGKPNISRNPLGIDGILYKYPQLKGVIFSFDSKEGSKKFYGLYRSEDSESDVAYFIEKYCDFHNDNLDSARYLLPKV